jgi:hypothetical protein
MAAVDPTDPIPVQDLIDTVVTNITNNSSGTGRTALQVAADAGVAGPIATLVAEAALLDGRLERIEGGAAGVRYAVPGKGV